MYNSDFEIYSETETKGFVKQRRAPWNYNFYGVRNNAIIRDTANGHAIL